eukprot:NODE_4315_length_674_cov_87.278400_g3674_i0.p1 GENE.NODE_4315_length_674_cov_87.278400_g3674_i0~~NODE_4315_length_674_cov_87.278400_g3674_i0.p1  ORF type:complete len:208 (-),score=1.51 NODE_4315_length_674_cov_87.278400_g3674_i0:51-608(-)
MLTSLRKIKKAKDEKPTDLEKKVCQALFDLELNSKELKGYLQKLHILSATEIVLTKETKCILIFVPERQDVDFKRINVRVVRELEKKFSGSHVLVIPQRRFYMPSKSMNSRVPMRRTFRAYCGDVLDDVVYPVDIVGKRTRIRVDGTSFMTVKLDEKKKDNYEHKLKTFGRVYRTLTGKRVIFEF